MWPQKPEHTVVELKENRAGKETEVNVTLINLTTLFARIQLCNLNIVQISSKQ
jgi:hypothetical protein